MEQNLNIKLNVVDIMENKIYIEDKIYHGLAGGIPFWEKNKVIEMSLIQLKLILMHGGIFSRNILKQFGVSYNDKKSLYNGDDYISVCLKDFPEEEMYGENFGLDSAYFRYVRYKIALVLDTDLKSDFRTDEYKKLPGERQIKNKISIEKLVAISIGIDDIKLQLDVGESIKSLCAEYGVEVPIVDSSGTLISTKKECVVKLKR